MCARADRRGTSEVRTPHLMRLQNERVQLVYVRGLAVIANVRRGDRDDAGLRQVERDVRGLRKSQNRWAEAIAAALDAGIAASRGQPDAGRRYEIAAAAFESVGMVMHEAAARRRGAELLDEAARAPVVEAADRRLVELGIVHPERFGRMLVA